MAGRGGVVQRAPNAWDRFYRYQHAPWRGERSLEDLLPHISGRVLELGCGNGKLLRPLMRRGVDVVGLDISWHAVRRLGQEGFLADAASLPFAGASFRTVLDIHCTGHLLAHGRAHAAAEKARILCPGGRVVVERLAPDDLRAANGSEPEPGTRELADGRTTHFSTAAEIASEHPGLRVVDASQNVRHTRHRGVDVMRSSVRVVLERAA